MARAYEKVEAMESDRIEFMRVTLTVFADRLAEMGAVRWEVVGWGGGVLFC